MSISIIQKPFLFDFANNLPFFTLAGTPTSVTGRKAVTRFKINTMPHTNRNLNVSYGTKSYSFLCKTASSALNNALEIYLYSTNLQIKEELEAKIAGNYYISNDFDVVITEDLEITFTARQVGGSVVSLQTDDSSANIQLLSTVTGIERRDREGYKVFAKLEVTRTVGGVSKTTQTPEILLQLDTANRVSLPMTLLRSYFTGVDIPAINESFRASPLKYALLKYRLIYSDYFDGLVQLLKRSDERYLVNGKISESHRAVNLPDWSCPMGGSSSNLSTFARPRSYGSPSGLTLKNYTQLPQYACFMLFYSSESSTYAASLNVRVDILNEDGTVISDINIGTVTLSNFTVVRVPLSVNALSLLEHSTQILRYTVRIYHNVSTSAVWTRTFVMQEKPFYAKEFLLQNRYGFLETFFIDNEMVEKSIEGEKVTCSQKTEIDITDVSTIYTARTGFKSDIEMKLLSEAVENRFNYKIVNNSAVPITILPDTFTIIDEAQDLQTAEFQYVFNTAESLSKENRVLVAARLTKWEVEAMWVDSTSFNVK